MNVTDITNFQAFVMQIANMNATFWNTRYKENETVYGLKPNPFFKRFIDKHKPGTILLPAEGEGRNAVYAAQKGWKVDAFDFSEVAKEKALKHTENQKLDIHYWVQQIETFTAGRKYDAIALLYVHLPGAERRKFHHEMYNSLASGGFLLFEAFAKEQIHHNSGGPKDPELLYDAPSICDDFPFLHQIYCGQKEVELDEGPFHQGKAALLQLVGQKL